MVSSKDLHQVVAALDAKKHELNLHSEIKWSKVTAQYLNRYMEVIDLFFDFIRDGKIKVRIMFRKNEDQPSVDYRGDDKYFKLYYQFIKNAFGLRDLPEEIGEVNIRIYLDQLPDTKEKCDRFKDFLRNLPSIQDYEGLHGRLHIRKEDVADVVSHEHVLLQCTDIVLGSMYFRLNQLHLEKPCGCRTRGKRTIAKEKLYKHINKRISEILPNFNIGISTGERGYQNPAWETPYRHWRFIPK